jgi:hypothetical protein
MLSQSVKLLKQSGFSEQPSEKIRTQPQRYPSQYDESSVRTDITEADIMNYVRRVADKANDKAMENSDNLYCQNKLCDNDVSVQDCPQNECYKNYLNPGYMEPQKIEMDKSKKIFFENFRDIITSQPVASYQTEPDSYVVAKDRVDELLKNRQPKCDVNMVETPLLEDMRPSNGVCSGANPNGCDRVYPNVDCGNRECYKKYLVDEFVMKPEEKKEENKPSQMRIKFDETEMMVPRTIASPNRIEEVPFAIRKTETPNQKSDFQKKYNTLVVNKDIAVPDFIDVLIVVSETPIKITLPHLQGPTLISSVGNVTSSSNLLVKNLSLCSHQIMTKGGNKIDTVRTSVSIEPAGKKMLGAVNDSWILL